MPKPSLKNPFARRRSSGNILDGDKTPSESTAQSSFRVIERQEKATINFDAPDRNSRTSQGRSFGSPLQNLRGKSVDDLTYLANGSVDTAASRRAAAAKAGRDSAGTTNSVSSDVYPSSSASGRHSSSSTLPSSIDPEHEEDEDELYPKKRPQTATASQSTTRIDDPLPPPPKFSARAQRAFSFGLRSRQSQDKAPAPPSKDTTPVSVPTKSESPSPTRERALTTSSYASTAVPLKLETPATELGRSDFGDDFGNMFDNNPVSAPPVTGTHRTDSAPMYPPRSYSRQDYNSSPANARSNDAMLSQQQSPALTPHSPPGNSLAPAFFSAGKSGYSLVEESNSPVVRQQTPDGGYFAGNGPKSPEFPNRQQQLDDGDRWSKPAVQITPAAKTVTTELAMPWDRESSSATPKALNRTSMVGDEEPLFDRASSPAITRRPVGSARAESDSAAPKKLTKAQFEILQQYGDKSLDDKESDDEYDDVDDLEKVQQVTKQRRKQEANMSVYRQSMMKSTAGGPTDLPRPNLDRSSSSAPSLYLGGVGASQPEIARPRADDDEDDDVPLGILQAHGFPSGARPPTRNGGEQDYRPVSTARNSNMPVFARRLPEDPYFGAGLVNPAARESLAFSGGGSVYGASSAPTTPGGLVGVIASEEKQRQSRRGSPNPVTGTYNSMPLPANMPGMNRSSSMASMQMPPGMTPGMPMMTPPADMQQFMAMQMQMMQSMQNMQHMLNVQQAQLAQAGLQPQTPGGMPRPMSTVSNLPAMQGAPDQRSMSMMTPPSNWNAGALPTRPLTTLDPRMSMAPSVNGLGPAPGYTPSIAPSERSNVGMPSRYRPVQTGEDGRSNSLTSSMTLNALQIKQENNDRKSTIRVVDKAKGTPAVTTRPAVADEDEDSSWGEMFKKRAKGKRSDRASKSAETRVALSELYPNVE